MTESATIGATSVGTLGSRQFQGLFSVIPFKFLVTEASIADADQSAGDVAVPGAVLGDFVMVECPVDLVDGTIHAQVTAADVVTIIVSNDTGSAITALSGGVTFKGVILRPSENVFAQL